MRVVNPSGNVRGHRRPEARDHLEEHLHASGSCQQDIDTLVWEQSYHATLRAGRPGRASVV